MQGTDVSVSVNGFEVSISFIRTMLRIGLALRVGLSRKILSTVFLSCVFFFVLSIFFPSKSFW